MKTLASRLLGIALIAAACAPAPRHGDGTGGAGNAGGASGQGGNGGAAGAGGSGGGAGGSGGGAGKAGCGKGGATFGGTSDPWTNPVVQCHWTGGGRNVVTTPLVIDLDGDGKAEIVFSSSTPGDSVTTSGVKLHAIRGADCGDVWSVDAEIANATQLAAGDLDGDGKPEIVGYDHMANVVHVYDAKGGLLASSDAIADLTPGSGQGSGPAIADVDGAPPAEIVIGATVLRLAGGKLDKVWSQPALGGHWGTLSLVADVDLDGAPDVVSGNHVWDAGSGADKTPAALAAIDSGYAAVAQMDPTTPEPEIVLVSSQAVTGKIGIYSPKTGSAFFGPYDLPSKDVLRGVGGGPVVADFDGDGRPEIGVSTPTEYRVYDPECAESPPPAKCAEPGVLWKSTIKDESSGGTSSSVFDFNNDCEAEVVYRDECWLRIYEGKSGKVLAAYAITSGTALEEPVIADVDGDGHAEIVVSSDNIQEALPKRRCPGTAEEHTAAPWTGYTQGVFVLRDGKDPERWASARRIWNQNTYHVTNVNEDGTIPTVESRSWETVNSYRQNVR